MRITSLGGLELLTIGPYDLESQVLLAPMAGVTDLPFRKICRNFGAGLTTSEMLTSDTRLWHSNKSANRLEYTEEKGPISMQIAGSDPKMLANAAQESVKRGAQIIDINMGCPAKKVCRKLAGSALLKDETLVAEILNSVVGAVNVPVTLKTRTGWDILNKNGPTVAKIAEDAGIAAIAIHGRTRACKFSGEAEFETVKRIVETVSIPVIANGDIASPSKAKEVLENTNAAAIMIGRAAWGNPWIFDQINRYLRGQPSLEKPSLENVVSTIETHFRGLYSLYGELKGLRIARKHYLWYSQTFGLPNHVAKQFNDIQNSQSQIDAVYKTFEQHLNYEENVA